MVRSDTTANERPLLLFPVNIYIFRILSTLTFVWALACKWANYLETVSTQPKKARADFASKLLLVLILRVKWPYLWILAKCKNNNIFSLGQIPPANPISNSPCLVQSSKLLACQNLNLNLVSGYFLQFIFGVSASCRRNPKILIGPESFPFFWWLSGGRLFSRQFWRYNRTKFW